MHGTFTAKMSACGSLGELYHYSVFALVEFNWNVFSSFLIAFNGSPIQNLVHTNITKTKNTQSLKYMKK